jgi:signal transduction histidine kinase
MSPRFFRLPAALKMPSGILRALIFIILVAIAIGFWLYMRHIIDHIREFQKSVITTQKEIYKGIIDPESPDAGDISSELFQKGVIESPFPVIFTDEKNEPIPGLWRNVPVSSNDTSEKTLDQLRDLIHRMDRVNPPDTIFIQALKPKLDTLIVYDVPPTDGLPFAITGQIGEPLLIRNLASAPDDTLGLIDAISQVDHEPLRFIREGYPPVIVYGPGRADWPFLVMTAKGIPLYWNGIGTPWEETATIGPDDLGKLITTLRLRGHKSMIITRYSIGFDMRLLHYGDPEFLSMIVWLPVIEFLVIATLIIVGFLGLMNITRAEQHSIWVGMAKETAHQLGTPISSIDGWLELLRTERDEVLIDQAVTEIGIDVNRLTRVAARFSSIGSKPELQPIVISDVIEEVLDYFRKRVPRSGHTIEMKGVFHRLPLVNGNRELLNWAFENLIKNAIAAIENRDGHIIVTGSASKDFSTIILDVADNGRGIPPGDQAKIMTPGFTTKKRGWGLGLSLVKRIIENYHGGQVFLLESRINEGTTIRVVLPAQLTKESHTA